MPTQCTKTTELQAYGPSAVSSPHTWMGMHLCFHPERALTHQELDDVGGAALLEDGNLAQEADVIARIMLLQLLHGHLLVVVPLCLVDLRRGNRETQ